MLGRARALLAAAWAEFWSALLRIEGSKRMRFLASRTALTSLSMSIVLKVGGWGRRSASVGAISPAGMAGRRSCMSYWATGSRSSTACSLRTRSVSVRSSSESGAGPSLSSPLLLLNACGLFRPVLLPLTWGMRDDKRPVDSSQVCADTAVGLVDVTWATCVRIVAEGTLRARTIEAEVIVYYSHHSRATSFALFANEAVSWSKRLSSKPFR